MCPAIHFYLKDESSDCKHAISGKDIPRSLDPHIFPGAVIFFMRMMNKIDTNANIQSPLHGYHHRETIYITYSSEFQNLLMILYPHDEAKRNSCRLWRDWSPASFCEHLNLVFPDVKNATDKSFVQCISGMEFAYNLYDVTLELNFSFILQEICDAFPDRTLAEEEEDVR